MKEFMVWVGIAVFAVVCFFAGQALEAAINGDATTINYPTDQELVDAYIQAEWGSDYYGLVSVDFTPDDEYVPFTMHGKNGMAIGGGEITREKLYEEYYVYK